MTTAERATEEPPGPSVREQLRSEVERLLAEQARGAADPRALTGFASALLAALEAGVVRAAEPDPDAAGGWRVNAWVKQGILLALPRCRASATIATARSSPRATGPSSGVLDVLDSPGARAARDSGAPWRIVPGGTTVRSGAHLEPGVTIMPPAVREPRRLGRARDDGRLARARRLVRPDRRARPPVGRSPGRRRARARQCAPGRRRGRRLRRRRRAASTTAW